MTTDLHHQQLEMIRHCWFLTGATASGKSELSLALAGRLNAEIVSLDSMAIYREMDLGTAKPTAQARQAVPHHLIDILAPNETFSVSQYREAALAKIVELRGRHKEVLFVGGTALYLQALLKGIFDGPPADWAFRQAIEEEVHQVGLESLHQRLKIVDPLSANKLHPNDVKRIIRALEVLHLTGKPISHQQREFEHRLMPAQCRVFWLHRPRPELHQRIEQRVETMFRDGLISEVAGLLHRYGKLSHTATQAVGYKEVIAHLEGQWTVEETIEQVKIRTRRFARAQETWFRNMSESRQLDVAGEVACDQMAADIIQAGEVLEPINMA
jgi:tRNA dimethylallyltransferase